MPNSEQKVNMSMFSSVQVIQAHVRRRYSPEAHALDSNDKRMHISFVVKRIDDGICDKLQMTPSQHR